MHPWIRLAALFISLASAGFASSAPQSPQRGEELQTSDNEPGRYGGTLTVAQRSEPKTLNPVTAADGPSREVIGRLNADLIHINRATQQTEPALAKSWTVSKDGRTFTLRLRHGLHFSDGQPFDADDVVFSFQAYLDEKIHSPQRDLLVVGGKPMEVQKVDQYTVRFTLAQPYAAAERLFDSLAILPRHLIEQSYKDGKFTQAWTLSTPPAEIAGMGPFRLKEYVPAQKIVLERNPYYWKADHNRNRLPYLDELIFLFVGNEDAQVIRFQAGDTDLISRLSAENYSLLSKDAASRGIQLFDLGPGLEYNFLVFNLNEVKGKNLDKIAAEQAWFSDLTFRQAVSSAIDRDGIVKLVYAGRGAPLWGNVSPSNRHWIDQSLPHPARSIDHAKGLLKSAGFSWRNDGQLLDHQGQPVEFSIITSSSSAQRGKMATIIQDDLSKLGMSVHVVPLEFRAMLDRVFQTYDYEAVIMGLGGGDADPNPEMNVWLSNGSTHLWHLGESKPGTDWEAQLDQLMQKQMVALKYKDRKHLYDQAQEIIAGEVPFVFLATPNILVGANRSLANFKPAVLEPTALWNVEQLYYSSANGGGAKR
ncbi:MAG TPA: ABC transporter substrate-binding protein [Terriglobales bacterium]|nr:ABC transporter substrate-binding protein [Terriglobales bacterium]